MIDYSLRAECAHCCADAVGHYHKEALSRRTDVFGSFFIYIQRARYIKEVESHAVDNHREDKEPHAVAGIAETEKAEAEYPCAHGHEHHGLDAVATQEERYQEYTECLAHLRYGDEGVGVVHAPCVGELRNRSETLYEGVGKTVGNLQGHTQKHGEYEEYGHVFLLEECECLESQGFRERFVATAFIDCAFRHGKRVQGHYKTENAGGDELSCCILVTGEVDKQHSAYKTDSTEHAHRREVLHAVEARFVECRVCYRVRQTYCGHEEGYRHCVESEENSCRKFCGKEAVDTSGKHERSGDEVAYAECFLGLYPAVGHNAYQGRHEK